MSARDGRKRSAEAIRKIDIISACRNNLQSLIVDQIK
jgi:hypothetical protein